MNEFKGRFQLSPLVIKGYKFFNSFTGENVIIKGIDYYPRPNSGALNHNSIDFFTSKYRHIWERDIPHFLDLGINALRIYSVDPSKDHSEFMCALQDANIYVMVELASQDCAILKTQSPACYPNSLKTRGQAIIKEFSRYTNTLAFSAGNEVNHYVPNGEGPEWNAPCLKKFIQDMRRYVQQCPDMRNIPIGLTSADTDRELNALYYNCPSEPDKGELDRAEFYGINSYVVCNGTVITYDEAPGFQLLVSNFENLNYSIPVMLTEYGCLSQTYPTIDGYEGQRTFHESEWFGLPEVRNTFAGGFAFEYSIEGGNAHTPFPFKIFGHQNFGVGYMSPENCDDIKIFCKYERTPSFYNLKAAYSKLSPDYTISFETFEVDRQRVGPSFCPSDFPSLDSFLWSTESVRDLKCPSKDTIEVCYLVQVKSIWMDLIKSIALILSAMIFIACTTKRIRERIVRWWNFPGVQKASGHKGIGLRDGESETLISSSMSIEPNYESIDKTERALSTHE